MAKGRVAKQAQTKLNMIIYGNTFTGKTTLASQLAFFKRTEDGKPFRILYIDCETGGLDSYLDSMEQAGVDLNNIYILYTQSLTEVRQYIAKVKNHEPIYILDEEGNETNEILMDADGNQFQADAIIVDGASILYMTSQQGLMNFSKKRNKVKAEAQGLVGEAKIVKIEGSQLEIKDYSMLKFKGNDLILDLMSTGVHCIVTCREAEEKQSIKTEDGQFTSISTGKFIPEGFKGLEYNSNTVLRTFYDKDTDQICAQVLKDRTGVHKMGEIIEDPSLLDYQVVVNRDKDKQSFALKNDLTKAVEVEQNLFEKETLSSVGIDIDHIEEESSAKSTESELDSLKKQIVQKRNTLSPSEKTEMKARLQAANLPLAYKNVTDINILKKVLTVFNS